MASSYEYRDDNDGGVDDRSAAARVWGNVDVETTATSSLSALRYVKLLSMSQILIFPRKWRGEGDNDEDACFVLQYLLDCSDHLYPTPVVMLVYSKKSEILLSVAILKKKLQEQLSLIHLD